MSLTLDRLRPFLLKPNIKETVVVQRLLNIQNLYTEKRENLPHKEWDEFDVSSYTSFYLSTNYQKFKFIKERLPIDYFESMGEIDLIDFGTGPGTYLLSYLDEIGHEKCKTIIGIDKSSLMLKQASLLLNGLHPDAKDKLRFSNNVSLGEKVRPRFLMFGNAINELDIDSVKKIITRIDPDYILLIEPGTPLVFEMISSMRKWFKDHKFDCDYPCANLESRCPVAVRSNESKVDWCHQVWRGAHHESIERLSQLIKIDRKTMPLITHLYRKGDREIKKPKCRFIRFLNESKHSFEWEVCLEENQELEIIKFEIPKNKLDKEMKKRLKKVSVGLGIEFELIKKLDSHKWRVLVKLD
jgi:hypothetical protein